MARSRASCWTVAVDIGGLGAPAAEAVSRAVGADGASVMTLAATAAARTVNPATESVSREGLRVNFSRGRCGRRCADGRGLVGLKCRNKMCLWSSAQCARLSPRTTRRQRREWRAAGPRDQGGGPGAGNRSARWVLLALNSAVSGDVCPPKRRDTAMAYLTVRNSPVTHCSHLRHIGQRLSTTRRTAHAPTRCTASRRCS